MKKNILYIVIIVATIILLQFNLQDTITYLVIQLLLVRLLNSEFITKLKIK